MKFKYPLILLLLVLIMSIAVTASADSGLEVEAAQSEVESYIVLMNDLPVIASESSGFGAGKQSFDPNSARAQSYQRSLVQKQNEVVAAAGVDESAVVYNYTVALNGFSAFLTKDEVRAIEAQPDVSIVLEDQMRYPTTDSAGKFLGLTRRGGAYLKGYTGEGVVVGIIDTGIWPEHPSFADDGSYDAPPIVLDNSRPNCEFGNMTANPLDEPFTCNNKLIGARQMLDTYRLYQILRPDEYDSARDDGGHGTHTASTAAGNAGVAASYKGEPLGTISGIAPRAHIVAYKGLGYLGGYTSDLAAAIDQAVADGVDVINYSIGGGAGEPSADEIAFLFAANAGVHVATSAGNAGPNPSTLGNPGTMPWMTTVGASTQRRFFRGTVILGDNDDDDDDVDAFADHGNYGDDGTKYYGASITSGTDGSLPLVDAEFAGGDLCVPGTLDSSKVTGKIVLCRRGAIARADKSRAVWMADGAGMIMYNNSDDDNLASDSHWVPSVHIDQTPGLAIKDYIETAANPTARIRGVQVRWWRYAPSMTIFSSRGPNPVVGDIIKPDITAPGTQILAGYSPTSYELYDPPGEFFAAIQGTSMSSPIVAGIFALMDQAHPDWSPAMVKSALMTTAYQDVVDNDRSSPADPFDMGSGHANPGGKWKKKGTISQPGLVYDAGLFEYVAFTCGQDWGVFTPGSCDFLDDLGIPSDSSNLNYPSIGIADLAGSRTVERTVTSVAKENGWRRYKVRVDAPEGYEVTVEPSVLWLKSGDSATYEVTVTNISAPIGEWAFGSLSWSDRFSFGWWWPWSFWGGRYDVYSPIAVRASLFSAPAEVSGSGESGSASFDVSFGYTGSYAAAPHGLEPAVVTSDNVLQDPDQNFDPLDGFSNEHQFPLLGAAFFRIAIPPEATEPDADLDIFVYNPNGVQVAASTAGGTNELVHIDDPMDGTWSVFVHGWAAPGGDSDYDMYTWAVSATPGGNLVINSAPASATIGATETIDVSWTGATGGEWRFGAVSHTGDAGLMGYTLVNVDNR